MEIEVSANGYPVLEQFSEDGFVDCVFRIENMIRTDNHFTFQILSSHEDKIVGLNVRMLSNIRAGFDPNMDIVPENIYYEGVVFSRSGQESDRLVQIIAWLYGFEEKSRTMVSSESFTAIALHQGPIDIETEPVKIKLFGNDKEDDIEDDYYESFFNVDLQRELVFWNEKDSDYREALIRGMSKY